MAVEDDAGSAGAGRVVGIVIVLANFNIASRQH